jgi:transposase
LQGNFIALNCSLRNTEAIMRGQTDRQLPLFHTFEVEDRIRGDHPLRDIKRRADRILASMSPCFEAAYSSTGRPSVPPERLLKSMLLMALYSIRSERQLCEQIDLNLLFRWFLDMQPSDEAFVPTVFTKNRHRLDEHALTKAFFDAVVAEALHNNLCSEHFSVDGTLIQSFASDKSFRPKAEAGKKDKKDGQDPPNSNSFMPRNPDVDFHGQKRSNATHQSETDPEAKLYRKSNFCAAKLSHLGHVLAENRHGLIVSIIASEANGTAERTATFQMLDDLKKTHGRTPATLGADKAYDDGEFFQQLEGRAIEPHIPLANSVGDPKTERKKKRIRNRLARGRMLERMKSEAYSLSQRSRKKVEECFGWLKEIAGLYRSRLAGRWKLTQLLEVSAAAFNLIRLRRLIPTAT